MNPFDVTVFHFINQFAGHNALLDMVMEFFAKSAPELYAVLFIISWFMLPRTDGASRHALVVSVCAGIFALLINVIIAHFWYRSRPFVLLPKGTYTQLIPHANDSSFPSDHASGSFAFSAAVWGKTHKSISYLFTSIAVIVMIARVYVGVHWPTDVLAGMVIGIVSGRMMWKFSKWIEPITKIGLRMFKYGKFASPNKNPQL